MSPPDRDYRITHHHEAATEAGVDREIIEKNLNWYSEQGKVPGREQKEMIVWATLLEELEMDSYSIALVIAPFRW